MIGYIINLAGGCTTDTHCEGMARAVEMSLMLAGTDCLLVCSGLALWAIIGRRS